MRPAIVVSDAEQLWIIEQVVFGRSRQSICDDLAARNIAMSSRSLSRLLTEWNIKYERRPAAKIDEQVLHERVAHAYHHLGISDKDTARLLQDDEGVSISPRTLRRVRKRLGLVGQSDRTERTAAQCDAVRQSISSSLREWQSKHDRRPVANHDGLLDECVAQAFQLGLSDQETALLIQDQGVNVSSRTLRRVRMRLGLLKRKGGTSRAAAQRDAMPQLLNSSERGPAPQIPFMPV